MQECCLVMPCRNTKEQLGRQNVQANQQNQKSLELYSWHIKRKKVKLGYIIVRSKV